MCRCKYEKQKLRKTNARINEKKKKGYPIPDLITSLIYIPHPRGNCSKTIPFTAAHTYIAHEWQQPPG